MDPARESARRWDLAVSTGDPSGGIAMIGYRDLTGAGVDLRVAGAPVITALIEFGGGGALVDDTEGQRRLGGFVVGLPARAMRVRGTRAQCVEVRLAPARAYSMVGITRGELGPGAVDLDDLWGAPAQRLRERLAQNRTWEDRFATTAAFLTQRERTRWSPDPEVLAGWHHLLTSGGRLRIGDLAETLGWSQKRLRSRFESQIGLTPKRAAMLVRFRRAVDGLLAGHAAADVAIECGYTDQAHLCRDVALFAGRTPGEVQRSRLIPLARHRYGAWSRSDEKVSAPPYSTR